MSFATIGRARLFSGVVAALVLTTAGDALAQNNNTAPANCPASLALARRAPATDTNVSASLQNSIDRLVAARASQDQTEYRRAAAGCLEQVGDNRRRNLPATLCVGEASLAVGDLNNAHCAYDGAARLAEARSVSAPMRAQALEGRARALLAVSPMRPQDAAALRAEAIASYRRAIAAEATPTRRMGFARLLMDAGDYGNAETEIRAVNPENIAEPAARASAQGELAVLLAQLAHIRHPNFTDDRPVEANVVDLLNRSRAANDRLIPANGPLGIIAYRNNDVSTALSRFNDVLSGSAVDGAVPGARDYRAEANYHLSLMEARTAQTDAQWDSVIQRAQAAGTGDFRYRRHLCLSYLARGGDPVRLGQNTVWCDIDRSAEGELLRGMYYLRYAQYLNTPARRYDTAAGRAAQENYMSAISNAARHFGNGLNALQGAPTVQWPGDSQARDLRGLLQYGRYIAQYCSESLREDPGQAVSSWARPFYESRRVLNCDARGG